MFLDYFTRQYLDKNSAWYEGANLIGPSTSNGIERFNLECKNTYWKAIQTDVIAFMNKCCMILNYVEETTYPCFLYPGLIKTPYNESIAKFKLLGSIGENCNLFLFLGERSYSSITPGFSRDLYKFHTEDLDFCPSMKKVRESYSLETVLIIVDEVTLWHHVKCSCKPFLKSKTCRHIAIWAEKNDKFSVFNSVFGASKNLYGKTKKVKRNNPLQKD